MTDTQRQEDQTTSPAGQRWRVTPARTVPLRTIPKQGMRTTLARLKRELEAG